MTSSTYRALRDAYWDAQAEHRRSSIAEVQRLMPDNVSGVVLELSDNPECPRLRFAAWLLTDGTVGDDSYFDVDEVDQIACDLEAFSYEEADSFLDRYDAVRFMIARVNA